MPSSSMIIDSTTPNHIFTDRAFFGDYTPSSTKKFHRTALGEKFKIKGTGTVWIEVTGSDGVWSRSLTLYDCWHVKTFPDNVFSCTYATSTGWEVALNPHNPYLRRVLTVQNNQRNQPSRAVGNNQRDQPSRSRVVEIDRDQSRSQPSEYSEIPFVRKTDRQYYLEFTYTDYTPDKSTCLIQ